MSRLKYDLTGQKFGEWEVLEKSASEKGPTKWKCRCTCGTIRHIPSNNLRNGKTQSCGCKRGEKISAKITRHGQSISGKKTKVYNIWATIKQRCGKYPGYENISICDEWKNSFESFAEYIGDPPTNKHSVDRKDSSGNYEPGNVRWASPTEQARNKEVTIKLTYKGVTKPLREWCEIFELPPSTVHARIKRYGMSVEEALEKPIKPWGTKNT